MPVARFFAQFGGSAPFNMAFDEWLMGCAMASPGATFLRLYTWQPGAITFGYNQRRESALDWGRVGETPVIRRVTGGRALYHDPSELTYAIVVNGSAQPSPRLTGSLPIVSASLASALGVFLAELGIEAAYERKSAPQNAQPAFFHTAPCFASSARYELMSAGRKIVASAQKRLGDVLLQHGSVKIDRVCGHPALNPEITAHEENPIALSEERFGQLATLFRQVMGRELEVDFAQGCPDYLSDGLSVRIHQVEEMACDRREIIAQSDGANSL